MNAGPKKIVKSEVRVKIVKIVMVAIPMSRYRKDKDPFSAGRKWFINPKSAKRIVPPIPRNTRSISRIYLPNFVDNNSVSYDGFRINRNANNIKGIVIINRTMMICPFVILVIITLSIF
jgi:hypothetical protein